MKKLHIQGFKQSLLVLFALFLCLALVCLSSGAVAVSHASGNAYVRVNQVGYLKSETKQAILMASGPESGATFRVINTTNGKTVYAAPIGASQGNWSNTFPNTYLLDLSTVQAIGSYKIAVTGPINASSPGFEIGTGANLYAGLLPNALFFYQTQRDGSNVNPNVMNRRPAHLTDERASIYDTPNYVNDVLRADLKKIGGPIDVSGGWFDAGDYLKFVQTASYTDAIMLLADRQYPSLFNGGAANFRSEGRYGLDWLQKMWDNTHQILYYQVGIGDGNGTTILADHDFWRLPQADDKLLAKPGDANYYVEYRPVFRIGPSGSLISPNLAGRLAADFALCYQVYRSSDPSYANKCLVSAENIFDLAKTSNVGQLVTAAPYDYYPETEWRDDMELGATELYYATAHGNLPSGLKHTDPMFYLNAAAHWANAYIHGPNNGTDSLNLYDVSGLAHYELFNAISQAGHPSLEVTQVELLNDLRLQLINGTTQAKQDPFGLGIPYGQGDATPHALGYALEGSFYDQMSGTFTYNTFGLTERNWVLGVNAWGASFVVGAGTAFPHCMQHVIANLSGSLDGKPPIVLGATVDGPSAIANFSGLGVPGNARVCPPNGSDSFKVFTGKGARYFDNVVAWPSVEPADDYTALTILVFAGEAG